MSKQHNTDNWPGVQKRKNKTAHFSLHCRADGPPAWMNRHEPLVGGLRKRMRRRALPPWQTILAAALPGKTFRLASFFLIFLD